LADVGPGRGRPFTYVPRVGSFRKVTRIGYARVSSIDQGFDGQVERLKAAGCKKIFAEKLSGKSTNGRHELTKAFKALRPGDVLIITKLDRLARSIRDLLNIIDQLKAGGVMLKALDDTWLDTTSPHGELIFTIMGAMAEFERKLIRQRCEEGIQRAKAQGKQFGRPGRLDAGQRRKIAERHANGESMAALAEAYDVGVATIFRALHP
jgi:DNA invertase Pin-like site-specific DNA recombinase